ncbi:MotE family protein [Bacillus solitudinis]|uniref:MotE family protein n=1 Tax=Bacillus solitudinis TaxID=2014074 RepID=UPI000C24B577|nr:MotE family protein [Bacillus solitudinis]
MNENEKKHSKFQWFFLVLFIPTLFALILFSVILSFIGIDVIDRAKQIGSSVPFLSDYIEDEEKVNYEEMITNLENTNYQLEMEIEQLQREVEQNAEERAAIENERNQMEQRLAVQEELANQVEQDLVEIAKTYETMSAKNAASIIGELETEEALLHVSQVSTESRAAILSKMEASKAAEIMRRLVN